MRIARLGQAPALRWRGIISRSLLGSGFPIPLSTLGSASSLPQGLSTDSAVGSDCEYLKESAAPRTVPADMRSITKTDQSTKCLGKPSLSSPDLRREARLSPRTRTHPETRVLLQSVASSRPSRILSYKLIRLLYVG